MRNCLKKLYHNLKNRFFPPPPPPPPDLSDLEYENLLMHLIARAKQGDRWTELQVELIQRKVSKTRLVHWLRRFRERCLQEPELHQELARDLRILGRVATGEVGNTVQSLAIALQEETGGRGDGGKESIPNFHQGVLEKTPVVVPQPPEIVPSPQTDVEEQGVRPNPDETPPEEGLDNIGPPLPLQDYDQEN